MLLVKPPQSCPTGQVFQALGDFGANLARAKAHQSNDLEAAAIHICPIIGEVLALLREEVSAEAAMTGSGSACFALVPKGWQMTGEVQRKLQAYWHCLTAFS